MTEEMRCEYSKYHASIYAKAGLILFVSFILAMILPSFLPKDWLFCKVSAHLGVAGLGIIIMVIFSIMGNKEGKSLVDMAATFRDGMMWPMLWLVAVTLPLGDALVSPEVGVSVTLSAFCLSKFAGLGLLVFTIAGMLILGLLTQFFHNIVMGVIFIPLLVPIGMSMGGNPFVLFFVFHAALACAFGTPAASMWAGMLFGRQDMPTKHAYAFGWLLYVLSSVVIIALGFLLGIMLPY